MCDVGPCAREPVVRVTFVTGGTFDYCDWHGYFRGVLRWKDNQVEQAVRLR